MSERVETEAEIIDGPFYTADSWQPFMRHINKQHWAWQEAEAHDRMMQRRGWKPMTFEQKLATANLYIRCEREALRCLRAH